MITYNIRKFIEALGLGILLSMTATGCITYSRVPITAFDTPNTLYLSYVEDRPQSNIGMVTNAEGRAAAGIEDIVLIAPELIKAYNARRPGRLVRSTEVFVSGTNYLDATTVSNILTTFKAITESR